MTAQLPPTGSPVTPVEGQESWRTYLDLFLRWWWLILLSALVAGGIGAAISFRQTPIYQTSAKLLINKASTSYDAYSDMVTSGWVAQTYAQWMSQKIVIDRTMAQLGVPNDPVLIAQQITAVTAVIDGDSQIIRLTVEGPNPELIAAFAQTLPQVFARWVEEVQTSRYAETKRSLSSRLDDLSSQIQATQSAIDLLGETRDMQQQIEYNRLAEELSRLRSSYNTLADTYENLLLTEAQSVDTIAVIEEPYVPGAPVRPRPMRTVAMALVMGAMIAGGFVFLYELYIDRFRSIDEVRMLLGTPILGSIRRLSAVHEYSRQALVAINAPRSMEVETFRRLRTNLRFADVDRNLHTIAVTSANPNEGKSVIAANLAVVMAQAGLSVILVDGDLRKPKLHQLFEMARTPGLSDALTHDNLDAIGLLLQPTEVPNLRILTVGRKAPNPSELLSSQRMRNLIATLQKQADVVLIDTPPVLAVADSQIISTQVEGMLMVLDPQRTTRKMAQMAVEALDQVNANIIGVTLNRLETGARGYGYYQDHYDYYEEDGDGDSESGGRRKRKINWPWQRQEQAPRQLREQQVYAARPQSE